MTLDSVFGSVTAPAFCSFGPAFNSVFLFVTGAFNFSGTGFATARDGLFAFDATVFAALFDDALVEAFSAAVVFTAGFAIDLLSGALVAAAFGFFAAGVGFAGFFIAFAMESIPTGCSRAPSELRLIEPMVNPAQHSPARP